MAVMGTRRIGSPSVLENSKLDLIPCMVSSMGTKASGSSEILNRFVKHDFRGQNSVVSCESRSTG